MEIENGIPAAILAALLSAACAGTASTGWQAAGAADTVPAYTRLLLEHPREGFAEQARSRVEPTRTDLADWKRTLDADTIGSYLRFLKTHPDSPLADEARGRIVDREVSYVMLGKHGRLPPLTRISGSSDRGYSVLNVQNNTPHSLTIRYSGPNSFKVTFAPREKGSLEVLRGDYKVVASLDVVHIRSYAGRQTSDGGDYEVEYYLVTTGPSGIGPPSPVRFDAGSGFEPWPNKRSLPDSLK